MREDPKPTTAAEPPTFETALAELQRVVHDLEEGQLGLEASLARFETGIELLRSCCRILDSAEQKIEILTGADAAGNPETAPFDATASFDQQAKGTKKPGRKRSAPKGEPNVPDAPSSPAAAEPDSEDDRLF
jgi:exodeoxyribonuclease VII small subunit